MYKRRIVEHGSVKWWPPLGHPLAALILFDGMPHKKR
uniref:Uncharacterized protein n=1 Tax=Arundo donax TaxID=35708 RepID=A0A0A9C106_ARUDO